MRSTPGGSLSEGDQLIVEAASGVRRLTSDELRRVQEHVAAAGFDPSAQEQAGGRLTGLTWQGRVLRGTDRLIPAEAHYLRHVVVGQEWPPGTSLANYLRSIREVALDPTSGLFTSQFRSFGWHLAIIRRSGALSCPRGHAWVMVEYRVGTGRWMTAFQLAKGLAYFREATRTAGTWLRQPIPT